MSKPAKPALGPASLSLDDFLPYRLSVTANLVSEVIATTYRARYGLKTPEWRAVAAIGEAGALTQQDICARTRMDKVTVHRAAQALGERSLVARSGNPVDRRSHRLALTAEGEALYAEVAPRALELERRLFAAFATAERARFTTMLQAVDAAALALLKQEPAAG